MSEPNTEDGPESLGVDFPSLEHLGGSTSSAPEFTLGLVGLYGMSVRNIIIPQYYYAINKTFEFGYFIDGMPVQSESIQISYTRGGSLTDLVASMNAQIIQPEGDFVITGTLNYTLDSVPFFVFVTCINGDLEGMVGGMNSEMTGGGVVWSINGDTNLAVDVGTSGATDISVTAPMGNANITLYAFLGLTPSFPYGDDFPMPISTGVVAGVLPVLEFSLTADEHLVISATYGSVQFPPLDDGNISVYTFLGLYTGDLNTPVPVGDVYTPYELSGPIMSNGPDIIYLYSNMLPLQQYLLGYFGSRTQVILTPAILGIPIPPGETYINYTPFAPLEMVFYGYVNTVSTFDFYFTDQATMRSDVTIVGPSLIICQPGVGWSIFLELEIFVQ